jgi:hypothetical protein
MNKDTLELLQSLAAKLGTTADHLWGVMIRQARVSVITDLLLDCALVLVIVIAFKKIFPFFDRKIQEDPEGDFLYILGTLFLGAVLVVCTVVAIFCVPDMVTKIANPEYWALQQILETVKGAK